MFLCFLKCRHFFDVGGIPLIFCALYSRERNIRESVILKRLRYMNKINIHLVQCEHMDSVHSNREAEKTADIWETSYVQDYLAD